MYPCSYIHGTLLQNRVEIHHSLLAKACKNYKCWIIWITSETYSTKSSKLRALNFYKTPTNISALFHVLYRLVNLLFLPTNSSWHFHSVASFLSFCISYWHNDVKYWNRPKIRHVEVIILFWLISYTFLAKTNFDKNAIESK